MNSIIRKIKNNEGGIAVNTAIAMPAMLLVVFMIMDLLYISNQRNDIQRRADSATLTMVNMAKIDASTNGTTEGTVRYYENPDGNLIYCSSVSTGKEGEYTTDTKEGTLYCYIMKSETGDAVSPCEITQEYYQKGIDQFKTDIQLIGNEKYYDETEFDNSYKWENLSDEYKSSLKQGIAELRFAGQVHGLFSKFSGINFTYKVYIESQAVCNYKRS